MFHEKLKCLCLNAFRLAQIYLLSAMKDKDATDFNLHCFSATLILKFNICMIICSFQLHVFNIYISLSHMYLVMIFI